MRPLEYQTVDQMDGFENDEPSQLQPPIRGLRSRVPSARKSLISAWVLFGAGVIIGVIILGQTRPHRHDDSQNPSTSVAGEINDIIVEENDENDDEATAATNLPTSMPLAQQDTATTDPPTAGESCDMQFDCISDRLGQNEKIFLGKQFVAATTDMLLGCNCHPAPPH